MFLRDGREKKQEHRNTKGTRCSRDGSTNKAAVIPVKHSWSAHQYRGAGDGQLALTNNKLNEQTTKGNDSICGSVMIPFQCRLSARGALRRPPRTVHFTPEQDEHRCDGCILRFGFMAARKLLLVGTTHTALAFRVEYTASCHNNQHLGSVTNRT